ncbi:unnamed protein product [Trichobilharzia regenti]|nr:unnamed protein product [Trichobilharzia regenti]
MTHNDDDDNERISQGQERQSQQQQQQQVHHNKSITGCILTPLSSLPNMCVEAYLGNLDFFFIRETTDLREVSCSVTHSTIHTFLFMH